MWQQPQPGPGGAEWAAPAALEQLAVWEGCDPVTMNLEWGLHRNITEDEYFRGLLSRVQGFTAVVAECRDEGDCCNAWTEGGRARGHHMAPIVLGRNPGGNQGWGSTNNSIRGCTAKHQGQAPSRLWCILLRLFQLRPSEEQVRGLLSRSEQPLVRALGILYVRLTQHPSRLTEFLAGCAEDVLTKVPLSRTLPGRQGESTTLAAFCRTVLLEQKCLETVLPRIPQKHLVELQQHLGVEAGQARRADAKAMTPREREEARWQARQQSKRRGGGGRLREMDGPAAVEEPKRGRSRSGSPAARRRRVTSPERPTPRMKQEPASGSPPPPPAQRQQPRRRGAEGALAKLMKLV